MLQWCGPHAAGQSLSRLEVDVNRPGHRIPERFFGLMTEEINHAYDGGLYAELIQNRSFQDPGRGQGGMPIHWFRVGDGRVVLDTDRPVNAALPNSLRLDLSGEEGGIANDGYWGIPVRPNTTYTASFFARAAGGFRGPVKASIRLEADNTTVVEASSPGIGTTWKRYTLRFTTPPTAPTTAKARFVLSASGRGQIWFSMVSLFPPTFGNVPNGLRPDLMRLMEGLKPKFIRLPGGNYLEGNRFSDRFSWKQMIGPPELRPGHMGCWGYRSSDGFGLPEFMLWCRQLNAEPVLCLFAGYVLNGDYFKAGTPEMALYTQEALEEIEYFIGPKTSRWGRKRAADGFPEPFPLKYVEIGNEDWFDRSGSYDGRFTQMAKAIRRRYPHLQIIATAPVKSFKPDLYDDHFYRSPAQLMQMATMYDKPEGAPPPLTFNGGGFNGRQPGGIKTFVGEWAAQEGRPTPNLRSALGDAAFIMGMEKNSDAVVMQCYAPLLVNVNPADPVKGYPRGWQWNTNLIGYDALSSFGSASYYAQAVLAQNRGDVVLPVRLQSSHKAAAPAAPRGGIGVGSWHTQAEYTDIRVTAADGKELFRADLTGDASAWRATGGSWRVRDGAIGPTSRDAETWAVIGNPDWTDYTVRLRARKTAGREGFIVLFHAKDGENYHWWNIGGWENTLARCEAAENGARGAYGNGTPFTVETGRWYDLRLEVSGNRMRGYIDGRLITDTTYQGQQAGRTLFATATYSYADSSVLVKIVNFSAEPTEMEIKLNGLTSAGTAGKVITLSGDPNAVNTLEEPTKIAPKTEALVGAGATMRRSLPPHSLTILRIPGRV
jgi:alpha-L-arabinofuranosidase